MSFWKTLGSFFESPAWRKLHFYKPSPPPPAQKPTREKPKPSFAPAYVGLYPILAEVAREHGYALAVHGSVVRDFDLIAAPWTDKAADAETLIWAMASRVSYSLDSTINLERLMKPPYTEKKPHGRRSWAIPLDCGSMLDVSVMPRKE